MLGKKTVYSFGNKETASQTPLWIVYIFPIYQIVIQRYITLTIYVSRVCMIFLGSIYICMFNAIKGFVLTLLKQI